MGDSTTQGFADNTNWRATDSYAARLVIHLNQNGLPADQDDFVGGGVGPADGRVNLLGGAIWGGVDGAGGPMVQTTDAGDGFTFDLLSPAAYDHLDVMYLDSYGGSATVSVDGGPVIGTIQIGNSGAYKTQTFALPLGTYSSATVLQTGAQPLFIEGNAFWNSVAPDIQVYNAGEGGDDSTVINDGDGDFPGAIALGPKLALIDFGINDDRNATQTPAQTAANIAEMVADFRSINCDPIIIIPEPYATADYATFLPALRAALQSLSLAQNVPIIDLSATYGDDPTLVANEGLMADGIHPNATFYALIGQQLAALLTAPPMPAP
jgi:hypothetical protein